MQEKDILSLVANTLTEESKTIEIDIVPSTWLQKLLIEKGFLKSKKVYNIKPILVGNRYRISSIANRLPGDTFENGKLNLSKAWEAIEAHTEDFIYVVAVCIQNNKKTPSKSLLERLRWMDDQQFLKILDASLSQVGVASFMNSIILIKGANVLNVQEQDVTPVPEQG